MDPYIPLPDSRRRSQARKRTDPNTIPGPGPGPGPARTPLISPVDLTVSNIDRDFTKYLDLKNEYHHEFITRFRDHGENTGYAWEEIRDSANIRGICVDRFLDTYGMQYWGTPENREMYLLPDSLAHPEIIFTFPERRDKLKSTLMILLERKAKGTARGRSNHIQTLSLSQSQPQPQTLSQIPSPSYRETSHILRKPKRKANDEITYINERNPGSRRPEKQMSSRTIQNPRKEKASEQEERIMVPPPPAPPAMSLLPAPVSLPKAETKASSSPIQTPETPVRYENETYFLVRASHQLDAAPAWVKYKEFDSAASFLTQMGQECGLPTWRSANAQLAAELEGSPPLAGVMASVKLEWTDDEVLVRWGRDSDLEIIAGQVRRAWLAKDLGFRCIQCFKIAVLLHVRDWE